MRIFYKGARLNGWDWFTGRTINYRENIGKVVQVPKQYPDDKCRLCHDSVLHASRNPNYIFISSRIPTAVFKVTGKPVVNDGKKYGFKKLKIIEEIPQTALDDLFGWRYSEACNPVHPFKLKPRKIDDECLKLLKAWAPVGASVRDSVWDSVSDSVRGPVWDSVWDSVGASVWDSVRDSVGASVWDSVWDSVSDSVRAYIGSLFPNIKKWKYTKHKRGVYPFQPAVDLWKQGLVASFDGETWRLHGGKEAKILWEGKL